MWPPEAVHLSELPSASSEEAEVYTTLVESIITQKRSLENIKTDPQGQSLLRESLGLLNVIHCLLSILLKSFKNKKQVGVK